MNHGVARAAYLDKVSMEGRETSWVGLVATYCTLHHTNTF